MNSVLIFVEKDKHTLTVFCEDIYALVWSNMDVRQDAEKCRIYGTYSIMEKDNATVSETCNM